MYRQTPLNTLEVTLKRGASQSPIKGDRLVLERYPLVIQIRLEALRPFQPVPKRNRIAYSTTRGRVNDRSVNNHGIHISEHVAELIHGISAHGGDPNVGL
jgi:hypothetical protein